MPAKQQVPDSPEAIAQKFYDQARGLRFRSNAILVFIVLVLIAGAISILYLPNYIAEKDRDTADFSLEDAVRQIENRQQDNYVQLLELRSKFLDHGKRLSDFFRSQYGIWQREEWEFPGVLSTITALPDGRLVAVGGADSWSGTGRSVIATRGTDGTWIGHTPETNNQPLLRTLWSVAIHDGSLVAVGSGWSKSFEAPVVLTQQPDDSWNSEWIEEDGNPISGALLSVVSGSAGRLVAVGYEVVVGKDGWEEYMALIVTRDAETGWVVHRPEDNGLRLSGHLSSVVADPQGQVFAVGASFGDDWLSESSPVIVSSTSDGRWDIFRPSDEYGDPLVGSLTSITRATDERLITVGYESNPNVTDYGDTVLVMLGDGNGNWAIRRPKIDGNFVNGRLGGVVAHDDRTILGVGQGNGDFEEQLLVVESDVSGNWTAYPLSEGGQTAYGMLRHISSNANGDYFAVGTDTTSFDDAQVILTSTQVDPRFDMPTTGDLRDKDDRMALQQFGSSMLLELDDLNHLVPDSIDIQRVQLGESMVAWDGHASAYTSLDEALSTIQGAFAEADFWHRTGRIATRVAIIALLIYLVQIAVHLYRYNSRLGGFYQARGDAIALMHANYAGRRSGLEQVKLPDLVASLSPDGISFDKASPPTQQLTDVAKARVSKKVDI